MFASFKWENWTSLFYFIEQILPALASGKTVGCNLTWRRITSPSSRTVVAKIIFPMKVCHRRLKSDDES
jgi:hypothetical protein